LAKVWQKSLKTPKVWQKFGKNPEQSTPIFE
jgi:hypothetical protein